MEQDAEGEHVGAGVGGLGVGQDLGRGAGEVAQLESARVRRWLLDALGLGEAEPAQEHVLLSLERGQDREVAVDHPRLVQLVDALGQAPQAREARR